MTMICDNCGARIEQDTKENKLCPICKGKLLTEAEYQEREELYNAIKDEEIDPNPFEEQEEEQDEQKLITNMKEDIFAIGNDELWLLLEDIPTAKERIKYRNIFFKAGGQVPTKEKEMDI